ncbi:MAG: A/G-specific adenine glycosylase [Pseudomonadota bacterium]
MATGFVATLLDWYDRHARDLPWRIGPAARAKGERADPYRVWLSEIMLQQTTVAHATRYFIDFTQRWPTVEALAAADDAEVMAAWAGLGYYARARNLLKCARVIAERGAFPETQAALKGLPGIGAYTSGAIAAIAFGQRAAAVDGNVDRVFARQLALKGEWKTAKKTIDETVETLVPSCRPGEFAEALMDLGATVCTPKRPNCLKCPVSTACAARAEGVPERYPIKSKKPPKPKRRGHVYVLRSGGKIAVEQRPEKGLLGGMLGLPCGAWSEAPGPMPEFPYATVWDRVGEVRHVFTHFDLTLDVWRAETVDPCGTFLWQVEDALDALPSVFLKAANLALKR